MSESNGHGAVAMPTAIPVDPTGIPEELTALSQWVSWQYDLVKNRMTKVPYNARSGAKAQSNNPGTFSTFGKALEDHRRGRAGVGFVFTDNRIYAGVDLDACRNPATGELTAWAQAIVDRLASYADVSPSGYGVKIVVRGAVDLPRNVKKLKDVPTFGDKSPEIAIFNTRRFWCLTGHRHPGTPATVEYRVAELKELCAELWPPKNGSLAEPSSNGKPVESAIASSADDRVNIALKAMMKIPVNDKGDGSNRLLSAARQCVNFDLTDGDALAVFRRYSAAFPFPVQWSDEDFTRRLRDTEKQTTRGAGLKSSGKSTEKKSRGRPQPKVEYKPEGRIEIELTTEEDTINKAVAKALASDPDLYGRGGSLAMIGDDNGKPIICDVPEAIVRDRIAARIQFFTLLENPNGGCAKIPQHPPTWNVKALTAWRRWAHLRPLLGIVTTPTVRTDGSLLNTAGYDPATSLIYIPGDCVPRIEDKPTREDAQFASDVLLDVVFDFPFKSDAHRATWLAYLLTLLARFAYRGPAPLFAFDGTVAGTGKGLLAHVTFVIAFGTEATTFSNPTNDDEARKRITSLALSGADAILIDNIGGVFGSPSLDAALTSTSWGDRLLCTNKDVRIPLRVVWAATGNNIVFKPDTARRIAHIRLESKDEKPEEREGFKYPKLIQHVTEHRAELLAAALTILRAWFVAGKPEKHLTAWGSYEGWSAIIRQAVAWLDLPDPASTREEFRAVADRESAAFRELIEGLLDADPNGYGLQSAEIVERVEKEAESHKTLRNALLELCSDKNGKLTTRSIGSNLAHLRGRISGGRVIDCHDQRSNKKGWYVRAIENKEQTGP